MNNKKIIFALAGCVGGFLSGLMTHKLASSTLSWITSPTVTVTFICLWIYWGQSLYQTKSLVKFSENKMKELIKTSIILNVCSGLFIMALFRLNIANSDITRVISWEDIIRLIGWGIDGGIAGFIISKFVPNMSKIIAVIFGGVGAVIGCGIMYLNLFDLGYFFGITMIGGSIGLSVVSAEEFLRKSWVEVSEYSEILKTSGVNMAKVINKYTLTLGKTALKLGYTEDSDIKLKSDDLSFEKDLALLVVEGKKFFLQDLSTNSKTELLKDSPVKIKNCEIKVCY